MTGIDSDGHTLNLKAQPEPARANQHGPYRYTLSKFFKQEPTPLDPQ